MTPTGVSRARRAALAAAVVLAAVTAARLPAAWESGNGLNHVSGVWLGLASDLARGTFYRPLHAGDAWGGTRYFPLVFVLDAGLVRAGAPLVAAGEALSLVAGVLLALGLALLVRAARAPPGVALAAAALAFAGVAGQRALVDARGDLLPVALSALALALLAAGAEGSAGRARLGAAAALLVLAFAAKPTALSAAAAGVAALALRGARRGAAALGALVAAGAGVVVLAADVLSSGRFLAALRVSGAAGLDPWTALAAPVRLATELLDEDPAGLVLLAAAALALAAAAPALARVVRLGTDDPRLLPALWLAAAWATAVAVYAAPGTGVNHLVEVEAASAALLGTSAASARRRAALACAACAAVALAGAAASASLWRADRRGSRLAEIRAVAAALPAGPVLSEDPLVPLALGASPRVLDPFALRVDPGRTAPLAAALARGAYPSVVLLADLDAPGAAEWYRRGNLGPPLAAAIRAGYRHAATIGRYHLYLPRRVGPDAGVVGRADAR